LSNLIFKFNFNFINTDIAFLNNRIKFKHLLNDAKIMLRFNDFSVDKVLYHFILYYVNFVRIKIKQTFWEVKVQFRKLAVINNQTFVLKVFYEPRLSSECDKVFSDYTKFIKVKFS